MNFTFALKSKNLPHNRWETVLPESLYAVQPLLCRSTLNSNPHERFFSLVLKVVKRYHSTTLAEKTWPCVHKETCTRQQLWRITVVEEKRLDYIIKASPEHAWARRQDGSDHQMRSNCFISRWMAPKDNFSSKDDKSFDSLHNEYYPALSTDNQENTGKKLCNHLKVLVLESLSLIILKRV